jgi:hypothetical protein
VPSESSRAEGRVLLDKLVLALLSGAVFLLAVAFIVILAR